MVFYVAFPDGFTGFLHLDEALRHFFSSLLMLVTGELAEVVCHCVASGGGDVGCRAAA